MILDVLGRGLPWLLVALGCWLIYQLLRQNGRILLRLEALEERMVQLGNGSAAARAPTGLPPGTPAPVFELPDLSGQKRSLGHWRGQRLLLIFFNTQCGFCVQMASRLAALPGDGGDGCPLVLLIMRGSLEENRRFRDEHGLRCAILVQQADEVSSRYQANGTPMGYLLDEDGVIAAPLTVGAEALLALATVPLSRPAAPHSGPTEVHDSGTKGKANRGLHTSRLQRDGLRAGTPAPEFTLPRLDGSELSLATYRGRRVLLVFSDPECGPCMQLAPALEQLHRGDSGVQVLMVSRRAADANRDKAAKLGLTFPIVLQKHWEISLQYAMFTTPIAYLIDEQGVLATDVVVGTQPIQELLARLAAPARDAVQENDARETAAAM